MKPTDETANAIAKARLSQCYSGNACDWSHFYVPQKEMLNFASRYHLVYPALAYFAEIQRDPSQAAVLRPQLDNIYRALLSPRCWTYWHKELGERTWPLQERNLTYAGRLATFVGFYISAFGAPPAKDIALDERSTTYSELSHNLWEQMTNSPSCGVSCYHHQTMVFCNAHMLINNALHDRLFGTEFSNANSAWLTTVANNLLKQDDVGPLFFYGTQADSPKPFKNKQAVGGDFWALFLMSGVVPELSSLWFQRALRNVVQEGDAAHVKVLHWEERHEFSSDVLATAWAFCMAKELGDTELAAQFRAYLAPRVVEGFDVDPYISGVFLLGECLEQGSFKQLVYQAS